MVFPDNEIPGSDNAQVFYRNDDKEKSTRLKVYNIVIYLGF